MARLTYSKEELGKKYMENMGHFRGDNLPKKLISRDEVEKATKEYLESGGKIVYIPPFFCGDLHSEWLEKRRELNNLIREKNELPMHSLEWYKKRDEITLVKDEINVIKDKMQNEKDGLEN